MNRIRFKTAHDIAGIYASGRIAAGFLDEVGTLIKPGVTTRELDQFAEDYISKHGAELAFKGYRGYPGGICTSINEEVVHGIPGERVLKAGDLVSIDVGAILDGYYSDTARSYIVDGAESNDDLIRLMEGTERSLYAGIASMEARKPLRKVSRAISDVLAEYGLSVIRELTGHGTGFALHEEPTVYNFDPGTRHPLVENGLVIAIEPMATLGSSEILLAADNWTYRSADGSLAAHFEHTVACWDNGVYVLTNCHDEETSQVFGLKR